MARTRSAEGRATGGTRRAGSRARSVWPEVMTRAEAAGFLRVPESVLVGMVGLGGLPGRLLGSEWRFSKAAIVRWLDSAPAMSSRDAARVLAGAGADDPDVEGIVDEAYRLRLRGSG